MSNYKEMDEKNIVHTYNRFDILLASGKGAIAKDDSGKEYIDLTSGIGVNSLGYCNDAWADAISAQAHTLQHTSNLFYSKPQIELASKLIERTGMSKVFFGNSGAEANECAIKAARKLGNASSNNEKNEIVTLVNGFHGRTLATLTATGQDHYHENFFPFVNGFKYAEAGEIDSVKAQLSSKTCAIMIELIQGEGGVVPLSKDFVGQIADLCADKDILLIVDEVQTGIGRTGTLFAYEQYGINPDIVTFAKGIGSGLPIGGALFNDKTSGILCAGDHGTTFGGNPVVCSGACAVLETINEDFLTDVRNKSDYLIKSLSAIDGIYDISGLGLMIGFRVKDVASSDFVKKCMDSGVLMLTAKDKVRLLPPLIISIEEIDNAIAIIKTQI